MSRRVHALAPAIVVASAALAWWQMAGPGFFRIDDYIYFANAAARGRWSSDWLTSVMYQHWAPGHRAAFSLMHHATVATWRGVVLFEIALGMAGLAALYGSMRLLFGRSLWLLVPLVSYAFTFKLAMPIQWPSSGLQAFPSFAFSALTLYGFLRHLENRQWRWLGFAVASLSVGLLFYVRPLTMIVVLLAVRLLFLAPDLRPRAIARLLVEEKVVWIALALPVVAYVANYLGHDYFGHHPRPGWPMVEQYVKIAWLRNVAPGLVGTVLPPDPHLSAPWRLLEIGVQLALAALFALTMVRKRLAGLRAWAFILLMTLTTFALTASGRLVDLGPNIGYDARYVSDLLWLIPLGLVFALHPRRVMVLGAPWPATRRGPLAPVLAVACAAGLAVVTFENVHHSVDFKRYWNGTASRAYAENVRRSVQSIAARTNAPVRLPDGPVPEAVILSIFGEAHRSYVLPQYGLPLRVGDPRGPDAVMDDAGNAFAAHIVVRRRWSLADATVRGGALRHGCVRASADAPATAEIRLRHPLVGRVAVVRVAPAAALPATGQPLYVDNTIAYPATPSAVVPRAASGSATVDTGQTSIAGLRLDVARGGSLCLQSIELGQLLPGTA